MKQGKKTSIVGRRLLYEWGVKVYFLRFGV
jgi:hypothetical protein